MTGVSAKAVKAMVLALPGVAEGSSYGEPAYTLRGKFFVRLRDDDAVLVLPMPIEEREVWMEIAPQVYFVTDHYRGYPYVLMQLANAARGEVAARLEHAWRARATKTMIEAFDGVSVS